MLIGQKWALHSVATGAIAAAMAAAGPSCASAQETPARSQPQMVDEVVVTATKLGATRLGDVPVSITAIDQASIERAGMDSFIDYVRRVPGLGFQSLSAAGARDDIRGGRRLNLRGIESGFDGVPTVAYYIDDAPIPVMDPKLFDIERIEVLRGPQGTLYGANSMGGAIRLVLNKPQQNQFDYRGDTTLSATRHGQESYSGNSMVNVPLIKDVLALRAVGYYRFEGGYIDNVVQQGASGVAAAKKDINDERSWGVRVAAELQATPELTITPSIFHQKTRMPFGNYYDSAYGDLVVFDRDIATPERNSFTLYGGEVRWTRGNWVLFSATSYFKSSFSSVEDHTLSFYHYDLITADQNQTSLQSLSSKRLSEELRLSYKSDRWSAVTGFFYLDEDRFFRQDYPRADGDPSLPSFFNGTQANTEKQYALFGEGTFRFTDTLSATAGLRWFKGKQTQDTRWFVDGEPDPYAGKGSASAFSPKLQLSYKPDRDKLVYASATKGFRPGGAAGAIPTSLCSADLAALGLSEAPKEFEPDKLWSYEIGSKLSFNRRASLNIAAYRINWTNVQQTVLLEQCGFTFVGNVGKARSQGVEAELSVNVTDNLNISGSAGYTDAKFTRSNPDIGIFSGDRLPLVPKWTASASAQYSFPIATGHDAYVLADVSYQDKVLNGYSSHTQKSYALMNARFGARINDRTELVFFADNVFDKRAQLYFFRTEDEGNLPASLRDTTVTVRPRTIGVTVRYGL
ncbi:TonB-dependent receptor [Phenylobacterium sp. LjRoot225]|uniref:TonB-dependent receptor n=1 Tax=Phenylobacterium sp. LjRoot225 TaxID=3342285 RepID=UPI003ED0DF08